jgi:hypothetical protein
MIIVADGKLVFRLSGDACNALTQMANRFNGKTTGAWKHERVKFFQWHASARD